jgi:hypothetical protein
MQSKRLEDSSPAEVRFSVLCGLRFKKGGSSVPAPLLPRALGVLPSDEF